MDISERFSSGVVAKARRVPAETIEQDEQDESVWRVRSTRTGKVERVQFVVKGEPDGDIPLTDWIVCTCTNGTKRGGQAECYHAAAATLAKEARA